MKNPSIILVCYLLALLGFSLFFSTLGIKEFKPNTSTLITLQHPMMLMTIIVGLVALRFCVDARSFRVFLIVYSCLWLLRIPINYINVQITKNIKWYEHYGFNRFTFRYYDSLTKICTPLPFIVYWFINYSFRILNKRLQAENKLPHIKNAATGKG